jgi:hypothetical protein
MSNVICVWLTTAPLECVTLGYAVPLPTCCCPWSPWSLSSVVLSTHLVYSSSSRQSLFHVRDNVYVYDRRQQERCRAPGAKRSADCCCSRLIVVAAAVLFFSFFHFRPLWRMCIFWFIFFVVAISLAHLSLVLWINRQASGSAITHHIVLMVDGR